MTTTLTPRRRMMAATMLVAAGAVAAGTLAPPAAAAKDKFVAISYSQTTLSNYGYAHGNNLDQAIAAAQSNCSYVAPNCVMLAWSERGCVAVSERGVNPNGGPLAFGGGSGKDRGAARSAALRQSGGGRIVYSYCL